MEAVTLVSRAHIFHCRLYTLQSPLIDRRLHRTYKLVRYLGELHTQEGIARWPLSFSSLVRHNRRPQYRSIHAIVATIRTVARGYKGGYINRLRCSGCNLYQPKSCHVPDNIRTHSLRLWILHVTKHIYKNTDNAALASIMRDDIPVLFQTRWYSPMFASQWRSLHAVGCIWSVYSLMCVLRRRCPTLSRRASKWSSQFSCLLSL